jgi:hypothetical protein
MRLAKPFYSLCEIEAVTLDLLSTESRTECPEHHLEIFRRVSEIKEKPGISFNAF